MRPSLDCSTVEILIFQDKKPSRLFPIQKSYSIHFSKHRETVGNLLSMTTIGYIYGKRLTILEHAKSWELFSGRVKDYTDHADTGPRSVPGPVSVTYLTLIRRNAPIKLTRISDPNRWVMAG